MTHDYLWDKSGAPDPEVAELERLLGRFRSPERDAAPLPAVAARVARLRPPFLAAAAVLALACAASLWHVSASDPAAWRVVRVAGTPRAGRAPVDDAARLSVGAWLETDAASRATLAVSTIGQLDVEPNSRLRLVETREGTHRLAMARGTVHAFIWAPPGQFVIDTPSSRAVDLGCAYTLDVGPDGSGAIEVTAGWVAFEHAGRESFIPAGARCATRPRVGPGTPHMVDAPAGLDEALSALDFGEASITVRDQALARVLALARPEDTVTLWHLLARVRRAERDAVFEALARHVPPPASVTREGIRSGDQVMRDAWWDALDIGDVDFWRAWKRRWR
jgi:hypothetical protein